MIDDIAFIESLIKRSLPDITVFQNATDGDSSEIDLQNVPGRSLSFIRLLLSDASARAIRQDTALANQVLATIGQALTAPSDEPEAVLDLRQGY
ncbi:MAG: hypothetical protein ACRDHX_15980 [Chloroflexota bacterium]